MELKKYSCKISVFVINLLVLVVVVIGIKNRETNNFSMESATKEDIIPVDSRMSELQNKIMLDRENKLRNLNMAPKNIVQQNTTTTATTVTPDTTSTTSTTSTKKADTKTKTS